MEGVRLIQCYSCFCWGKHLRSNCPTKYDIQICSRCSETGHSYTECTKEPKCLNCLNPHPATARICPEYVKALESQKSKIAEELANLILPLLCTFIMGPNLINAFKTAAIHSKNPYEFLNSLLHSCQNLFLPEHHSSHSDLNSTNTPDPSETNSISDPIEILTKDESSLLVDNDPNSIINLATQTAEIELPKVILQDQSAILNNNFESPTQFGLTNNGIEPITNQKPNSNLKICGIVNKTNKTISSTLISFNTETGKEKIYLQIDNGETPELRGRSHERGAVFYVIVFYYRNSSHADQTIRLVAK